MDRPIYKYGDVSRVLRGLLGGLLANGPVEANTIFRIGNDDWDVSRVTLDRIKKEMGVKTFRSRKKWWWALPSSEEGE